MPRSGDESDAAGNAWGTAIEIRGHGLGFDPFDLFAGIEVNGEARLRVLDFVAGPRRIDCKLK